MARRIIALLALCVVALCAQAVPLSFISGIGAAPGGGGGATLVFNCTDFTVTGCDSTSIPTVNQGSRSGTTLLLTSTAAGLHQAGSFFYNTKVNVQSFATDWTVQMGGTIVGTTFVIQNFSVGGFHNDANGLGYAVYWGPPASQPNNPTSVAVKFDLGGQNGVGFEGPSGNSVVGVTYNGGPDLNTGGIVPEMDVRPDGINFHSGDVLHNFLTYNNPNLTLVINDITTGAQSRRTWLIDIPTQVGASTAWVGMTGSLLSGSALNSPVTQWAFYQGNNTQLSTPTFSPAGGAYTSTQSVSIGCPSGASCYYTTNGLTPTTASTLYTGTPISVSSNRILQAVAVESNFTDSSTGSANYSIGAGSPPFINIATGGFGSANGVFQLAGWSTFSGGNILLTDTTTASEVASAWYAVPVNVSAFTWVTTWQMGTGGKGIAFIWQNRTPIATSNAGGFAVGGGPYNLGVDNDGLAYTPIPTSVALAFDQNSNGVGVYTNGATPTGSQTNITGITLTSNHQLQCTVTYSGTTLTLNMQDLTTLNTFSHGWTVNIPSVVGASTAYIGYTAAGQANIQVDGVTMQ